jgi:formylmethanofuran dehydrogenase subunit E
VHRFSARHDEWRPEVLNLMMIDNYFEMLLEECVKTHGHLCPGQVLGTRMSLLGLREIGIDDPKGKDRKNIIVFVEIDRCAIDAVQSITGCSLGHRTMKFMDYGKMAVTFLNLKTDHAVRVIAKEESKQKAKEYFSDIENKYAAQIEAYKIMPDADLFDVMEVKITVKPEDMPGRPLSRVPCDTCGEYVQDAREVYRGGRTLCKSCAGTGYYEALRHDIFSSCVKQFPHKDLKYGHQDKVKALDRN